MSFQSLTCQSFCDALHHMPETLQPCVVEEGMSLEAIERAAIVSALR